MLCASRHLRLPLPRELATTDLGTLLARKGTAVVRTAVLHPAPLVQFGQLLDDSSLVTAVNSASSYPLPWASQWAYFQRFDGGDFCCREAGDDGLLPVLDGRRRWAGGAFQYEYDDVSVFFFRVLQFILFCS